MRGRRKRGVPGLFKGLGEGGVLSGAVAEVNKTSIFSIVYMYRDARVAGAHILERKRPKHNRSADLAFEEQASLAAASANLTFRKAGVLFVGGWG